MINAAVIGAGAWGTSLAYLLSLRGLPVRLWVRSPDLAGELARTRINRRYLPAVLLPERVQVTADLEQAVRDTRLLLVAVPSVGVPQIAALLAPLVEPGTTVISAAKGLDHETGRRMTVVLQDTLPPYVEVGALSGPNLAGEVVAGQPSATVVAAYAGEAVTLVQNVLSSGTFRVYGNADVAGVELGGALKNPLAIAAGISDGLGYGDNAKAALMTRGLHEICRLGVALGADRRTFSGLCGFGDLLATCHSAQSRNRSLGEQLGRGRPLAEVQAQSPHIAEGVPTTRTALRLARQHGIAMPILEQLNAVLFEGRPVHEAVGALMLRDIADEFN